MTDTQFYFCVRECAAYTDRESYVSDLATSSLWGLRENSGAPQPMIESLGVIWDAVHRPVREIVSASGLTQAAFGERYCIPKRTVENWCSGSRECPVYVRLLLQRAEGLLCV